jgi:hypothetical protein
MMFNMVAQRERVSKKNETKIFNSIPEKVGRKNTQTYTHTSMFILLHLNTKQCNYMAGGR